MASHQANAQTLLARKLQAQQPLVLLLLGIENMEKPVERTLHQEHIVLYLAPRTPAAVEVARTAAVEVARTARDNVDKTAAVAPRTPAAVARTSAVEVAIG